MVDYHSAGDAPFHDEYLKLSAGPILTKETGEREPPLTDGAWAFSDIGAHYCTSNSATNPINILYRISPDFFRRVMHFVHFMYWLGGNMGRGWQSADPLFLINASGMNNFATWYTYEITFASGRVLTLKVGDAGDPRNALIFFAQGREHIEDPLTKSDRFGTWCQPGDMVKIVGNSVNAGRICAKVKSFDFAGLSNPVAGPTDTFTITLTHEVGNSATVYDPDNATWKPAAMVFREAWREEFWERIDDLYSLFCLPRTIELGSWDAGGVIELLDFDEASCRCAAPIAANDFGYPDFTVKVEVDYGGGYVDLTPSMRGYDATYGLYLWNRFAITHEGGSGYKTQIYLGDTDYFGDSVADLLDGAVSIRIFYMPQSPANDNTQDGARSTMPRHCEHCRRDYNNTIDNANTNGTGVDDEDNHWFCAVRTEEANVSPANLNAFRPRDCFQVTSCKRFQPANPGRVNADWWANIYQARNQAVRQLTPGWSNNNNLIVERLVHPSFRELFDVAAQLVSFAQYFPLTFPLCGGFGRKLGLVTDGDGNTTIQFLRGAIYNAYGDLNVGTDWGALSVIDDMAGVLPRWVAAQGDNAHAATQLLASGELDDTSDPGKVIRWNTAMMRQPAPVHKDCNGEAQSLQYTARTEGGIEGENRLSRFNRRTAVEIKNVKRSAVGAQPSSQNSFVEWYPTLRTVGSMVNCAGRIRIMPDGPLDHGARRFAGTAGNGSALLVESLGGGVFRIHCFPARTVVSKTVSVGVDSFDQTETVWTGANVGNLPDPLSPFQSYYNNVNDKTQGLKGLREGDTIRFENIPALEGLDFWVKRAVPCAGMDFSGIEGTSWADARIVGSYFNPNISGILSDGGDHSVVITDLEVKFLPSYDWQYIASVGSPRLNRLLYNNGYPTYANERPTTEADIDVDKIALDWMNILVADQFVSGATDGSAAENAITDASDPLWTDNQWQGLYLAIDGLAGQYWRIEANTHDTLILGQDIQLAGAGFRYRIKFNPTALAIGDSRAFPTYAMYYWCMSVGGFGTATVNRKYRVSYTIDDIPQPVQEIQLDPPFVLLSFPGDISKVAQWSVVASDLVGQPGVAPEALEYDGILSGGASSFYDLSIGPAWNKWKWHAASQRVVLHPNRAGWAVVVYYEAVTTFSLGARPSAGFVGFPAVTDQDWLYKAGIVDFYDEDGRIAALLDADSGALTGAGFSGRTSGVFCVAGTINAFWRETGDVSWIAIDPALRLAYRANGNIFLDQSFRNILPDSVDVRVEIPVANHTAETSAEMIKRVVDCVEACDEVLDGLAAPEQIPVAIQGAGYVGFDHFEDLVWPDGVYRSTALSPTLGMTNGSLPPQGDPALEWGHSYGIVGGATYSGPNVDPRNGELQHDYVFADYPDPGFLIYGCSIIKTEPGTPPSYISLPYGIFASIQGYINVLAFSHIMQSIPDGSTIIEAQMEVFVPEDAAIIKETFGIHHTTSAPGWESVSSSTSIDTASARVALMGETNDGKWNALAHFPDLGSLIVGKTSVIDFTEALSALLFTYRKSEFRRIGIYITMAPDGQNAPDYNLNASLNDNAGVIPALIGAFSTYSPGPAYSTEPGHYGEEVGGETQYAAWTFDLEATRYQGSPPIFQTMFVNFKLPDGVVKEMRFSFPANWPATNPR